MDENISRAAGAAHGEGMEPDDFAARLAPLRRPLTQRTTLYQAATAHIATASYIPIWQFTPRPGATDGDHAGDAQRDEGILDLDQERPRTWRGLDPATARLSRPSLA